MLKFDIIDNQESWDEIIKKSEIYDFHHTYYFHQIDTEFSTKLLYFYTRNSFIALPIVIRPIDNTIFFDITSVYGYSGPVYKFENTNEKRDLINFFTEKFTDYCLSQNIVSVFARLHPLIPQQNEILQNLGTIIELNKTVSIDLTIPADEQRKVYRKSLKSELNQLRKKEIVVSEATEKEEIDAFIEIYYETMNRVEAGKSYYFSKDYFYQFLKNNAFKALLLIAKKENEIVAGAIFTKTEKIMQYHLAGTKEDYIKETPMKLIIDEARLLGNLNSSVDLHLGGGVGGQDDDSLFRFKSGFSKNLKQFSVWKYIVNTKLYNQLSENKLPSSYFPLYRS